MPVNGSFLLLFLEASVFSISGADRMVTQNFDKSKQRKKKKTIAEEQPARKDGFCLREQSPRIERYYMHG